MAENAEQIPAASCSVTGEDPLVPATEDGGEKPKDKDPASDTARQPKRKKNCPTSLDKFESVKHSSAPNSSFSFTFDTKFSGTQEFTPRFGYFNLAAPETGRGSQIPATSKRKTEEVVVVEEEEEEEAEEKSEVGEERREVVGILSSVDGVESSVD